MLSCKLTNIFSIPGQVPQTGRGAQSHVKAVNSAVQQGGKEAAQEHYIILVILSSIQLLEELYLNF